MNIEITNMVGLIIAATFLSLIALTLIDLVFDYLARRREAKRQAKIKEAEQKKHTSNGRIPIYTVHADGHRELIGSLGYKTHTLEVTSSSTGERNIPIKTSPTSTDPKHHTITRRGKKITLTAAQYEAMKKKNREKMREYRAKKRATLAKRKK